MATSLFQTQSPPTQQTVDVTDLPQPGPNAFEVMSIQYDPDSNIVVVSLPNEVQARFDLAEMEDGGSGFQTLLRDSKLGPRLDIHVTPRVTMPKFNSPEEADAWLEANA